MPRRVPLAATVLAVALLAACAGPETAPTAPAPAAPSLGKTSTVTDPTATFQFPLDDAALGLRSDHNASYSIGGFSLYANGVCNTAAKIFATTAASNSGDATLNLSASAGTKGRCSRYLTIQYDATTVGNVSAFINVNKIQNSSLYRIGIGPDSAQLKGMNLDDTICGGLRWKPLLNDGTVTGADEVLVTRTDKRTWVVQTRAGLAKAYCVNRGTTVDIAVNFTIVADRDLP